MEYQITPEQGKELIEKLQAVALDIGLKVELTSLREGVRYRFNDESRFGTKVEQAFDRMVRRGEYVERNIEYELRKLFPHSDLYYSHYFRYSRDSINLYGGYMDIRPLSEDLLDILGKEKDRKNFESKLSKAILLGVNVFLSDGQFKTLQNCLLPIDHNWVVECLEEVKKLPTYTEEQLVEIFDGMFKETSPSGVILPVESEIKAVSPIPSSKKMSFFERMFGGG